jgi:Carboxypeptidase regulatory-like domain
LRRILVVATVAFAALTASAGEPSAVAVFQDRFTPPVRVEVRALSRASTPGIEAAWLWSDKAAPRRIEVSAVQDPGAAVLKATGTWLSVKIPRSKPTAQRLWLIAGPVPMWEEVPESLLPRIPIEPSTQATTIRIPVSATSPWRLRVAGPGVGSLWVDVPMGKATTTIVPAPAVDRTLKVDDEEKAPVARVRVSLLDANAIRGDYQKLADYRTDKTGRFVVQALPDAIRLTLVLGADGYAPRVLGDTSPSRIPSTLTIPRGATLLGKLVDRAGHPVVGAKLNVRTFLSPSLPVPLERSSVSDAQGEWTVTALPKGRGELEVEAAGFADLTQEVRLEASTNFHLGTVTLEKAVRSEVMVTDDRGQAVSGASLKLGARTAATSDRKGLAALQLADRVVANVTVSAAHYLTRSVKVEPPLRHPASVVLPRSFRVQGRLTDSAGMPVSAGHVVVHNEPRFQTFDIGENGRFDLDLDPNVAFTLELLSTRTAVTKMDLPKGVSGEVRDLGDVASPVSRVVTGRVLREDGTPVMRARVWLPRPSQNGPLLAWAFHDLIETVSEPTGEFALEGVPDVPFVLRVEAPGLAPTRRTVTPPSDGEIPLGDIRLTGGTTLTVSVDGEAQDDVQARVDTAGHGLPMDQLIATFFESKAIVPNVPAGAVTVTAWRDRRILCRTEVVVPADKTEMDVSCVSRRVDITGRVEVRGKPVGSGNVTWMTPVQPDLPSGIMTYGSGSAFQQHVFTPQTESETAEVSPEGTFKTSVMAGSWNVFWMQERGSAVGPRSVTISDAPAQEVVLQYPGYIVQGIVLDRDRKPVEGAQVNDLGGHGFATTHADGTFTLSGPDAGVWKLKARYRGDTSAVATRTVDADHDAPYVELVLDAAKSEIRAVVTRDRQPAGGAIVFLEPSEGGLELVTADVTGTAVFSVREPAPQRVRVAANVAGTWTFSDWMPADDAVKSGVSLATGATGTILVRSKAASGALTIASSDGWRVDRLLQWLGTFPSLSAGSDLTVSGVPPGTYTITVGGQQHTASVADGKTVETVFE